MDPKQDDADEFWEASESMSLSFDQNHGMYRLFRMMTVFFNFIQVEVTWLDELAEGLRNVIASSHSFRNWIDSLPACLKWKASKVSPFSSIIELMR